MQQISIDDIFQQHKIAKQEGRTAFIDECGNFGFDFEKEGTSKFYILCAVVVKNTNLEELHFAVNKVKINNGFKETEMKSSHIGANYKRRSKIIAELLPIDFRVILLVADKSAFIDGSPDQPPFYGPGAMLVNSEFRQRSGPRFEGRAAARRGSNAA